MTILEVRAAIINKLHQAVQYSCISEEIHGELNNILEGANPRDIIGYRWCDMISNSWQDVPATDLSMVFDLML